MSQKPMPVVSFVPAIDDLKLDPNYRRVWRVEYNWKSELRGWLPAKPFCFLAPAGRKDLTDLARIHAEIHCPRGAIGIELTAVRLSSPLTNQPD